MANTGNIVDDIITDHREFESVFTGRGSGRPAPRRAQRSQRLTVNAARG